MHIYWDQRTGVWTYNVADHYEGNNEEEKADEEIEKEGGLLQIKTNFILSKSYDGFFCSLANTIHVPRSGQQWMCF